jgi:hypothetical protein
LQAYKTVEKGPGRTSDLQNLPILDFNHVLYLVGPITAASGKKHELLFPSGVRPVIAPATFTDATGAVEVLAQGTPESDTSLGGYFFNEPLHLLGWRTTRSGFSLFMVGKTKEDLLKLLTRRSEHWQRAFFFQALILLALVFVIFWFLNMAVLSQSSISLVQVLVVNIIYLIFLYSALLLTRYPLWATLPYVLAILCLGNLLFVPAALVTARRSSPALPKEAA